MKLQSTAKSYLTLMLVHAVVLLDHVVLQRALPRQHVQNLLKDLTLFCMDRSSVFLLVAPGFVVAFASSYGYPCLLVLPLMFHVMVHKWLGGLLHGHERLLLQCHVN